MELHEYFDTIESLEFQVQFSILSGFRSVRDAMAEDKILIQLIKHLDSQPSEVRALQLRIDHLLQQSESVIDISVDESIAAYMFCLMRVDLAAACDAAERILDAGSLWWSVQIALYVKNYVSQLTESVRVSFEMDEPTKYTISDRIRLDNSGFFVVHLKSGAFALQIEMKNRQLNLLDSACHDSVESERMNATVSDATLQFNVAPARKLVPAVAG